MNEVDCRGLNCPQPVLNAKQTLENMEKGQIRVIVDNEAARDNVTRFAKSQGFIVDVTQEEADYILTIDKTGPPSGPEPEIVCNVPSVSPEPEKLPLAVKISNQFMGHGSEELGRILMKAFIKTLSDATFKPKKLVFYNSGVHLTAEDSEHLEVLKDLEKSGVEILVCGTCLDYYQIKGKLAVGRVSNMFEIIETLSGADRVISP
ncbi:MAG: sulfurtransferase-like selenium metabolism protein YedF [Deltaproteobacteria bacterium]|nr:sulfurtransferase-like selenium metabolism protein YedF [Deltaproteobacteria bacterium]MBW2052046.1 sulfurtransferase-like selenium metabolism protein YedF [Deltaproteobacteria bacterium]MBW2141499.1 sulfurtransferase-like selenium metabolism protein YedF [Deltaproteobacteria bacterium]